MAEIGINHNGDIDTALDMVRAAKAAGCDAVKFQKRTVDVVYTEEELARPRESVFGSTNGDLKHGLEFGAKEYKQIDALCKSIGIDWFASCWDEWAVDVIAQFSPPYFKIASACLTDDDLSSFEPLTLVPLPRALRLVIDGKSEIVEADGERSVRSANRHYPHPVVIRLTKYVHVPRRFRRHVTNTFLFARDHYRCQYCGRVSAVLKPRESLTRDHVVPLSRGGDNAWTNVVTACSSCNTRKANHLPAEIGMRLLHNPVEPHFVHLSWAVRRLSRTQAKYIRLFYGEAALHALRGH